MKHLRKSDAGFTIIEILIVLAIAGLIMLIIFLAVPALQRAQRDRQRKSAVSSALSQIEQYKADNKNRLPVRDDGQRDIVQEQNFKDNYLHGTSATGYEVHFQTLWTSEHSYLGPYGEIAFSPGHWCNDRPGSDHTDHDAGTNNPITGNHTRPVDIAVWTRLEGGGGFFCVDNSDGQAWEQQ